jgi:hypothetical protein
LATNVPHDENPQYDITFEDVTLTHDEEISGLINLDNNKAQGPYGIPARLLTETAYQIDPSFCALLK